MKKEKPLKELTPKEEKFCQAIIEATGKGRCKTEAYRKAGYQTEGMKDNTINRRAHEIYAKPHVQARIKFLQEQAADAVQFKVIDVLRHWVDIATADPNDLIQYRRGACRWCHGVNGEYHWISRNEYNLACARAIDGGKTLPDDKGGYGYDINNDPRPDCSDCHGQGIENIYIADTRRLKGGAKLLYAGLKKTRDGIEIKMRDQDAALQNIAKHFGMLKNKVEIVDPNRKPAEPPPSIADLDAIAASRIYEKWINGG